MARAYPQTQPQDFGQSPGEWQALRGELVALLDQVEDQVARHNRQDTAIGSISERMRDLRMQVAEVETETDSRHREALRSVKRAIDRFSDRDEPGYPVAGAYPERNGTANPRDTLQAAIQQIRARHGADMAPPTAAAPMPAMPQPAPRPIELPQLGELAHAVGGISTRLERLEGELRNQSRSQTGNVKEIAEQVAQLSHVVELLAGAVGETGQVKRLESQLAALAKMIAQGPQVDLSALNRRLDDVSATVGKLADLQVQYANKVHASDKSTLIADGMRAIEDGVRNVYDRIDSIERQSGLAPADLEPITQELARITEAMRDPSQPQGLVELIDVLTSRVTELENHTPAAAELKVDVEELRHAVVDAMEPRFAAIELQIESLSDRLSERPPELNVGHLEAQVRQLVARMDQTGEQLSGLARLYQQPAPPAPDFDALAELVASRTSEALVRIEPPATPMPAPVETDYEEIEKRVARAMRAAAQEQAPTEEFTGIRSSITEVNERLARLEQSLAKRAEDAVAPRPAPIASFVAPEPAPAPVPTTSRVPAPTADPVADLIAAADTLQTLSPPRRSDAMPANPAEEAPLTARPFPPSAGAGPIQSALEAKNGPRKRHPGLDTSVEPTFETPGSAAPSYDPASAAKPPRPTSSLEGPSDPFATPRSTAATPAADPSPKVEPVAAASEPAPSANTFIQAHRRASRQATAPGAAAKAEPVDAGGTTSLIGRALARFNIGSNAAAPESEPTADVGKAPRERKGVPPRKLAGDKQPRGAAWSPDDEAAGPKPQAERVEASEAPTSVEGGEADAPSESFITRYRRPILLAAVLVAASFLAANLVMQRLGEPDPAPVPEVGDISEAPIGPELLDAQPIEQVSSLSTPARVIELVDSLKTGSIDPMSTRASTDKPMAFAPVTAVPQSPSAFNAARETTTGSVTPAAIAADDVAVPTSEPRIAPLVMPEPLPEALTSPVKVEMPPEAIGPEALRQAAANGDARAQFEVAAIFTEGRAVAEDLDQAAIWYERSAAQGFAPAQYRLGNLYENGKGVEKDLEQARLWYQRAAEAGNRMAMHNLAALYAGGSLGKQEFESAAEWFEQAAARGMTDSQFNLGMLYARGLGVQQDMRTSYKWFSLAAARGDKDAATARDDIARSLGADDVRALEDDIAAWRPAAIVIAANYAPIGTWSDRFDPGETITRREVVLNVQSALNQLGYDAGTPDGLVGARTTEAIKAFERATGMSEVGAVNPRLLAVLGSQPV